MKYSHSSKHRKSCPRDQDHLSQMGYRLRTSRCTLAWSIADAAKYFQVTERTWHNWESGAHRIPFAVYKLCRVLAHLELPGAAWAGWSFQAGKLITPEGREIQPKDGAWWSLLVRNANAFLSAYQETKRLRILLGDAASSAVAAPVQKTGAAGLSHGAADAGLVPSKTSLQVLNMDSSQDDVIMPSWPILYDSPTPLTPLHAPKPITSASALTPSFALPWTPTCGVRLSYQRPQQGPHRIPLAQPQQSSVSWSQRQNPPSSPEPKRKPFMSETKPNADAHAGSTNAMTAAATAAKLATTTGGTV
jgi:DNA-binding transcriptional regulator YiaG